MSIPRIQPGRSKSIPHTLERHITIVQTTASGATTQRHTELTATDSEGRRYFGSTNDENGSGNFSVDDPVAGTRTIWNTESRLAKVLQFPTAVPGRKSCWKIPAEEQRYVRGEPQLGMSSINCLPAEQHHGVSCGAHGNAVDPSPDDSPEAKSSYEKCARTLATVHLQGKFSEKNEDLGVETIVGLEAHGCRSTVVFSGGTQIREQWWAEFGTKRRHVGLPLRTLDEFPGPGEGTSRVTRETTSLNFAEPDPAMFHPPDGYSIKTVEMQEVPCD